MLFGDQRIAQRIILEVELHNGARQGLALGNIEARGDRACGDIAHHDFQRNDLNLAHQLLAHVQAADEVRRHADPVQVFHNELADPVIEHALALQRCALLGVEGGRIILEVLDDGARFRTLIEDLGFTFVEFLAA